MTRDEARENAKVMQHYADGGEVEYKASLADRWRLATTPVFDFTKRLYRIKPTPAEGWGVVDTNDPLRWILYGDKCGVERYVMDHPQYRLFHWREVTE